MKIIFVLQVMFGWPSSGAMTNMTLSNSNVFDNYLECKTVADALNAESDKIPTVDTFDGKFYYACRPNR